MVMSGSNQDRKLSCAGTNLNFQIEYKWMEMSIFRTISIKVLRSDLYGYINVRVYERNTPTFRPFIFRVEYPYSYPLNYKAWENSETNPYFWLTV